MTSPATRSIRYRSHEAVTGAAAEGLTLIKNQADRLQPA
jgi:hypothetical protein